jgi:hypothetical protein
MRTLARGFAQMLALCAVFSAGCGDDRTARNERDADVADGGSSTVDTAESDSGSGIDAVVDAGPATDSSPSVDTDGADGGTVIEPDVSGQDASAQDAGDSIDAVDDAPADVIESDVSDDTDDSECIAGGRLACQAPCAFSFSSLDEDREGLRVVTVIAEGGGPVVLDGMTFEATSPLVGFSSGWVRYIERITDDRWTSSDGGRTLETDGLPLALPDGALEIELRFEAPDGDPSAGCPSGRRDRCGELVVDWTSCDGVTGEPVRILIRR